MEADARCVSSCAAQTSPSSFVIERVKVTLRLYEREGFPTPQQQGSTACHRGEGHRPTACCVESRESRIWNRAEAPGFLRVARVSILSLVLLLVNAAENSCTLPNPITPGYVSVACSGQIPASSCVVSCDSGYTGNASVSCATSGENFTLSGCVVGVLFFFALLWRGLVSSLSSFIWQSPERRTSVPPPPV